MERVMSGFEELGARLREEQDAHLERSSYVDEARERFLSDRPPRRSERPRWQLVAVAAVLVAALGAFAFLLAGPRSLTFEVGPTAEAGRLEAWIAAPDAHTLPIRFSDGTEATLDAKSRARVVHIDEHGARLVLEHGTARLSVVPKKAASWSVNAGPYEVVVTGTQFDVTWSPTTEQLVVAVSEGSVVVNGPLLEGGRTVVAGQTLRTGIDTKRVELTEETARETTRNDEPPTLPGSAKTPASAPAPAATVAPPPADTPSWKELARNGQYRDAVQAADEAGFAQLCATAGASEVLLLGDAARYSGQTGKATKAYDAVRRRFAGSGSAAMAAFSLGRMAFDQQGSYGNAARWFSTYLAESPGGALAQEAAGRLIEARQRSGNTAGAKAAAESYLKRFPSGPHANLARSLTAAAEADDAGTGR